MVYEIRATSETAYGIFATAPIKKGCEIFREPPLLVWTQLDSMLATLGNPETRRLREEIERFAEEFEHLPYGHPDKYPTAAREVMDRLMEHSAACAIAGLPIQSRLKYAALHDAHRQIQPGAEVLLVDLATERGRKLNGRLGVATYFDGAPQRWAVCVAGVFISVKPVNLKTPGGILRTNSFADGAGGSLLFEKLSRVNHSCAPNVQLCARKGQTALCAIGDAAASEELLIDYGTPAGGAEQRRAWLRMKYAFTCNCPLCVAGLHTGRNGPKKKKGGKRRNRKPQFGE